MKGTDMGYLGLDFIILSIVLLLSISFVLYYFRIEIKRIFYKEAFYDVFIIELMEILKTNYSYIHFNLNIIEDSKSQSNPIARKYIILDDIIKQFSKVELDKTRYPKSTPPNLHWNGYTFNSEPNKKKLPIDWKQRKNALLTRDAQRCFRCGNNINLSNTQIHLIKSLETGGKYFLENLLPICNDCNKILTLSFPNEKIKFLDIKEKLYSLIKK